MNRDHGCESRKLQVNITNPERNMLLCMYAWTCLECHQGDCNQLFSEQGEREFMAKSLVFFFIIYLSFSPNDLLFLPHV